MQAEVQKHDKLESHWPDPSRVGVWPQIVVFYLFLGLGIISAVVLILILLGCVGRGSRRDKLLASYDYEPDAIEQ